MASVIKAEPSLRDLLGMLTRETSTLVRQEVELAGAEVKAKAKTAATDVGLLVGGAAVAYAGLLVLLAALVVGIAAWMPLWLSALVIGAFVLVAGGVLAATGVAALKRLDPAPSQTLETLREDKAWLKEQFR